MIQAEAAERAVVGSILVDAASGYRFGALAAARLHLQPDDFSDGDCRELYEIILEADGDGSPYDIVALGPYLQRHGWGPAHSGTALLIECGTCGVVPSAAHAEWYAEQVAAASQRRAVVGIGNDLAADAEDPTAVVSSLVERAEQGVADVRAATRRKAEGYDLAVGVERTRARLMGEGDDGWSWRTQIPVVDRHFGGMGVGQQWVIGGRSGHMKTALALQLAWETMQAGHRVLMCRYEESEDSMIRRLASLESGVAYGDMASDDAREADVREFDAALRALPTRFGSLLRIHMGLSLAAIEGIAADWKPTLIIYDTLQAMADQLAGGSDRRRDLQVQRVCQFAARLCAADTNQHAAILISQLQKGSGQPTMAELRESGAIEETADAVLLLWWPYKERGAPCRQDTIVVKVGKNRLTGRLGTLPCDVVPGTQRFGALLSEAEKANFLMTV